ncbi:uncharacterized protein FN964_008231 isoform 1-T1 [Alca torda]
MSTVRAITYWFLLQNKVTTKSGTLWASWIKHKLISPPKPRLWNHNLPRFNFATKTCSLRRELLSPSRELLNSAGAVPGDPGLSVLREEAGQCCHGFHIRNSRFKNEVEVVQIMRGRFVRNKTKLAAWANPRSVEIQMVSRCQT